MGSHNDINILHRSLVFGIFVEYQALHCNYEVNDYQFTKGYYLLCRYGRGGITMGSDRIKIHIRRSPRVIFGSSHGFSLF
jgi:hypothetical protein